MKPSTTCRAPSSRRSMRLRTFGSRYFDSEVFFCVGLAEISDIHSLDVLSAKSGETFLSALGTHLHRERADRNLPHYYVTSSPASPSSECSPAVSRSPCQWSRLRPA